MVLLTAILNLLKFPLSSYSLGAERKAQKIIARPWPTQLPYAIATKINNMSQLTPCGALPIATVGRIMPATASKTAHSLLFNETVCSDATGLTSMVGCKGMYRSKLQKRTFPSTWLFSHKLIFYLMRGLPPLFYLSFPCKKRQFVPTISVYSHPVNLVNPRLMNIIGLSG